MKKKALGHYGYVHSLNCEGFTRTHMSKLPKMYTTTMYSLMYKCTLINLCAYVCVYIYIHTHVCMCACAKLLMSHAFVTTWIVACQAPLSIEFSR